jgi:FMN phosphatase YigB (HAD superfamily)
VSANDIQPAQQAGISTALIRRGPWGFIVEDETASSRCLFRLTGLRELPSRIREHNAAQG